MNYIPFILVEKSWDQCPHIFVTYALFFYTSFKTILDPSKNFLVLKGNAVIMYTRFKVAQQFHILLFTDNSIANISLYALSRPNFKRLSDLGINFLCTKTIEFCLLFNANYKANFCLRFASSYENFESLCLKQLGRNRSFFPSVQIYYRPIEGWGIIFLAVSSWIV